MILGVFGPWQLIVLLFLIIGIVVGIVVIFSSRAKHKAKAETLSDILDLKHKEQASTQLNDDGKLAKLERLNKLKQDGALTQAEFEAQKAKLL